MTAKCVPLAVLGSLLLAAAAGGCGKGGGSPTVSTGAPLCASDPGPAPLRRLTRFEYGRSLQDLTGVDPSVSANLPPDEESLGFDDIATAYSVSSLHAEKYLEVAETAAAALIGRPALLTAVAGCDPTSGDAGCVTQFIAAFGQRAWRRPLTADEAQAMQTLYTATADPTPADGVAGVVTGMLQAPQFIYRPEPRRWDPRSRRGSRTCSRVPRPTPRCSRTRRPAR